MFLWVCRLSRNCEAKALKRFFCFSARPLCRLNSVLPPVDHSEPEIRLEVRSLQRSSS